MIHTTNIKEMSLFSSIENQMFDLIAGNSKPSCAYDAFHKKIAHYEKIALQENFVSMQKIYNSLSPLLLNNQTKVFCIGSEFIIPQEIETVIIKFLQQTVNYYIQNRAEKMAFACCVDEQRIVFLIDGDIKPKWEELFHDTSLQANIEFYEVNAVVMFPIAQSIKD